MNIIKKDVGKRISVLREQHNLTMDELAKVSHVGGRSTVNGWEKGRSIPPKEQLTQIANYFKVSTSFLLYGSLKDYVFNLLVENLSNVNTLEQRIKTISFRRSLILTNFVKNTIYYCEAIYIDNTSSGASIEDMKKVIKDTIDIILEDVTKNNLGYGDDIEIIKSASNVIKNEANKADNIVNKIRPIRSLSDDLQSKISISSQRATEISKLNLDEFIDTLKSIKSIENISYKSAIGIYYNCILSNELSNFTNELNHIEDDFKNDLKTFENRLNKPVNDKEN